MSDSSLRDSPGFVKALHKMKHYKITYSSLILHTSIKLLGHGCSLNDLNSHWIQKITISIGTEPNKCNTHSIFIKEEIWMIAEEG